MNLLTLLKKPTLPKHQQAEEPDLELEVDIGCEDLYVNQLIQSGRYCLVLLPDDQWSADDMTLAAAWKAIQHYMALVPAGDTVLAPVVSSPQPHDLQRAMSAQSVDATYLDRYAVTNADFERFVKAGGYNQEELWPTEILPSVLQFVDGTGHPGPRFWSSGRAAADKRHHPVVGVCWYEANAYAHWAGKRLPTAAEWQRAVTWSAGQNKYPWGNAFDPSRANTWIGGPGDTVPVRKFESGCTPNGIYQLIGNVWEWVACCFECGDHERIRVLFDEPMGEIRGGAFDTYLASQATCQFRSGQPLLYRGSNVGFRCCVTASALRQSDVYMNDEEELTR